MKRPANEKRGRSSTVFLHGNRPFALCKPSAEESADLEASHRGGGGEM